eukprot:scaffold3993_cov101-Isochrysis_galbana.AAC.4
MCEERAHLRFTFTHDAFLPPRLERVDPRIAQGGPAPPDSSRASAMPRKWAVDLADGTSKEMVSPPGYSEHYREDQVRLRRAPLAACCTATGSVRMNA